MRIFVALAFAILCFGCTNENNANSSAITAAQAQSLSGSVDDWKLAKGLDPKAMQAARDRAYAFCLEVKPADANCPNEQDMSLIAFSRAISIWKIFQHEPQDAVAAKGYAAGHKQNPTAFGAARRYCWSIYADNGSRDARMLGPCMLDAVGGDFFNIVPVN